MPHQTRAVARATLYSISLRQPYRQALVATAQLERAQPVATVPTPDQAYLEGLILFLIHDMHRSNTKFPDEDLIFTAIEAGHDFLELSTVGYVVLEIIETRILASVHPGGESYWSLLDTLHASIDLEAGALELTLMGVEGRISFKFRVDSTARQQLAELKPLLAEIMGPPASAPGPRVIEGSARIMSVVIRRLGVFDSLRPKYISTWARMAEEHVVELGVSDDVSVDDVKKALALFCSPLLQPRVKVRPTFWRSSFQWDLEIEGTPYKLSLRILGPEEKW